MIACLRSCFKTSQLNVQDSTETEFESAVYTNIGQPPAIEI